MELSPRERLRQTKVEGRGKCHSGDEGPHVQRPRDERV